MPYKDSTRRRHVPRQCLQCSAPFLAAPGAIAEGRARFCSPPCGFAYRREHPRPAADRFWPRIDQSGECWLWTGPTNETGYGKFPFGGNGWVGAHVYAWTLASGSPPPPGQKVCHACDVPACVRNDAVGTYAVNGRVLPRFGHLFLGTDEDNRQDSVQKGRIASGNRHSSRTHPEQMPRGEQHRNAKLTAASVTDIRQRYAQGGISLRSLATEYGVDPNNIWLIVTRRAWVHIP
jgi:hypothetical protein